MWIKLDGKDQIERLKDRLKYSPECDDILQKILQREAEKDDPIDAAYRNAVETDDELEVDEDAIVSPGTDPGAWVHAWVWVTNEQAGIEPEEDEDDEDVCRTCGETYEDGGDGFDGKCPDCADKTDQKLHPENYDG
jgi:hypothetical protein